MIKRANNKIMIIFELLSCLNNTSVQEIVTVSEKKIKLKLQYYALWSLFFKKILQIKSLNKMII